MKLQLYLWSDARRLLLKRHDFYVAQVKQRVLANFSDIQREADAFAIEEFDRLGRVLDPERHDEADAAEKARDSALGFYALLEDLRQQMFLGALAGLYHQWDKDLRDHIERELRHYVAGDQARRIAWTANAVDVLSILAEFGWDCQGEQFFSEIDACRLVVNVHKHGRGKSLSQLAELYPEFLPTEHAAYLPWPREPSHENLSLTEEQFDRLAGALRQFWEAMPERLYLEAPANSTHDGAGGYRHAWTTDAPSMPGQRSIGKLLPPCLDEE